MDDSFLKSLEESENGFFQIENVDGKAFLTVFPAGRSGRPVRSKDVFQRLALFGITGFQKEQIESWVRSPDGEPHIIADWPGPDPQPAFLEVTVSPDKMRAYAYAEPPLFGGTELSDSVVADAALEAGVKIPLIREVVERLIAGELWRKNVVIAEGRPPRPEKSSRLFPVRDFSERAELVPDSRDRVDLRETHIIKTVEKGETIARIEAAVTGLTGMDITGAEIPFEKDDAPGWKPGVGTAVSKDGKSLIALIAGRPAMDRDGNWRVEDILDLDKVDYSTGNIDFPGTIYCREKIADGFRIRTAGSVIIQEGVGKVFIEAKGDIIIAGGVNGRGEGLLKAGGNLSLRFAEGARLHAGGDIIVRDALMHSEAFAGRYIHATSGRGEIIGGEIVAGQAVIANKFGSVAETRTHITVGVSPELLAALESLRNETEEKREVLRKAENGVKSLREMKEKAPLTEEELLTMKKLMVIVERYTATISSLESQYTLMASGFDPVPGAFAEAVRELHPGVEVDLGRGKVYRHQLRPTFIRTVVHLAGGIIRTGPQRPEPQDQPAGGGPVSDES